MRSLVFVSTVMSLLLAANAENKIGCVLKAEKEKYAIGEFIKFNFSVKNNSENEILLVQILDGSSCGFRQPQATLSITGPDGKAVNVLIARCGNTNILQTSDFIKINKGKEVEIGKNWLGLYTGSFKQTGKYKVKISYSTMDNDFKKWTGGPMAPEGINKVKKECGDLFSKRERVNISAETEIEILPKKE